MPSTATHTHVVTVPLLVSMYEMDGTPPQSATIAEDLLTQDLNVSRLAGQFTLEVVSSKQTAPGCHQIALFMTVTVSPDGAPQHVREVAITQLRKTLTHGHFADAIAVGEETVPIVLKHCTILPNRYHAHNGVVWKIAVLNPSDEAPAPADTVSATRVLDQQTKIAARRRLAQQHQEVQALAKSDLAEWTTVRGAHDISIGFGGPTELAPGSFVALSSTAPGTAFVDRVLLVTQAGEADARRLGLMGETPDAA